MNGANVYTLNLCPATTNIMISTEEITSIQEITFMGGSVFKSKYHLKATMGVCGAHLNLAYKPCVIVGILDGGPHSWQQGTNESHLCP